MLEHHRVGPRPVRATKLRDELLRWLGSLAPAGLADEDRSAGRGTADRDTPLPLA